MNQFEVKFWEEDKPTGTRSFPCNNYDSFEEVLFNCVISDLCMRKYDTEYWWPMLGDHVFVQRLHANAHICEYEITLNALSDRTKFLAKFRVEIQTIWYATEHPDYPEILLCEEQDVDKRVDHSKKKEKHFTKWILEESRAVRMFLLDLHLAGSLRELKKNTNKATYYRNLKICREKGFIVGDKLVRKVFVTK